MIHKKIVKTIKNSSELGARKQLIEELFYDFNRNRFQIYWMNFTRGIFFGLGTLIGGTVVVAFLIWILSQVAGWFPPIGDYIKQIIITVNH